MPLTRIACWKDAKQGMAVVIEIDGTKFEISHADLIIYDTEKKIRTEIKQQASLAAKKLPKLFFHKNKGGSIAIATGIEPKIWPEDKQVPKPMEL